MESQQNTSSISELPDQNCFVFAQNFHVFPFMRVGGQTQFLLRKKPSTGKFVEFRGKKHSIEDPSIIFSCGRKLFKKTAGLLTTENAKKFEDNSLKSEVAKLNLSDIELADTKIEQPVRIDHPYYQEFLGRVANTNYQYQIPSTQTVIYFMEVSPINIEAMNDYCKGSQVNFEFLASSYDDIINGQDDRISPALSAFLSQSGLAEFCTEYFVNQKAVTFTKNYAMFCCTPGTTHNKYHALYYSHFRKFGEKWNFYHIPEGEMPTEDEIKTFDAVITPGSPCAEYDPHPWKESYYQLLRNIRYNHPKIILLGVCFGAQTMASCFGGKVEKMPNDFLFGSEILTVQQSFYDLPFVKNLDVKPRSGLTIAESHGDHIVKLPEDAVLHASSKRTGVEIYTIGDRMLGFQGHPEYTPQWGSGVFAQAHGDTRKFSQIYDEVQKTYYPDFVNHEDLIKICFNFTKCHTPAF